MPLNYIRKELAEKANLFFDQPDWNEALQQFSKGSF